MIKFLRYFRPQRPGLPRRMILSGFAVAVDDEKSGDLAGDAQVFALIQTLVGQLEQNSRLVYINGAGKSCR